MALKRFLVGIAILLGGSCALINLSKWLYDQFRAKELTTVDEFDALNLAVLNTLPPPLEVAELDRSSNGITGPTNVHGRVLIVKYKVSGPTYDVAGYYQNLFKTLGWIPTPVGEVVTTIYIHDTTCADVYIFSSDIQEYWLIIWQDFAKQTFSPPLPPKFWLEIYEFGETQIYTCPRT